MADDYAAGNGTTGQVSVGGSTTGNIEVANDRDWFAVTLQRGVHYRLDLEGSETGQGSNPDPYLYGIFDAAGVRVGWYVDDDSGSGYNSLLRFTPAVDGVHYIEAGGYSSRTGTYRLSVAVDPDNTAPWVAMPLPDAVLTEGEAGEVHVPASTFADREQDPLSYRATMVSGGPLPAWLSFDPISRTFSGTPPPGAGDLTVRVRVDDGPGGGTRAYDDFLLITDDLAAASTTRGHAAPSAAAVGRIDHATDVDWLAVTLDAGVAYAFDVEGSATRQGSLADPRIVGLYDAAGEVLPGTAADDGGVGSNARLVHTVAASGTYFVAVDGAGPATGGYKLSVIDTADPGPTIAQPLPNKLWLEGRASQLQIADDAFADPDGGELSYVATLADGSPLPSWLDFDAATLVFAGTAPAGSANVAVRLTAVAADGDRVFDDFRIFTDDYAASTASRGRAEVGNAVRGQVETAGDVDWYRITLDAGTTVTIDLRGASAGQGTLADPVLRGIFDADGVAIAGTSSNPAGGRSPRVVFTPDEDGNVFIAVGAGGSASGSYRLSVREGAPSSATALAGLFETLAEMPLTWSAAAGGSTGSLLTLASPDIPDWWLAG